MIALTLVRLAVALLVAEGGLLAGDYFRWIGLHAQKGWPFLLAVMLVRLTPLYLVARFAASAAFRRQFQFRLRTLPLLVSAVAGLGSWGLMQAQESKRRADATAASREAGLDVHYHLRQGVTSDVPKSESIQPKSTADPFGSLTVDRFCDAGLPLLKASAPNAKQIFLPGARITDASLVHLQQFDELEILDLSKTGITDARLGFMSRIQHYRFWTCKIRRLRKPAWSISTA